MQRYRVHGGCRLRGRVTVHGAKNAALPVLQACVLAGRPCTVLDVPDLIDVDVLTAILRRLGARVRAGRTHGVRTLTVDTATLSNSAVPADLMRRMRSAIGLMGPLLARFGHVRVCHPGGCVIGPRPIDYHLDALRRLGARIDEESGGVLVARAERLRGAEVALPRPSVGATEHLLLTAVLAEGTTVIRGAAREPEVADLARFLRALGARITGEGTGLLQVDGVRSLGGAVHRLVPDRIAAGTLLCAAAATGGQVTVCGCVPEHLETLLGALSAMGCAVVAVGNEVTVRAPERPLPVEVVTAPHPGFPTDLQNPLLAALLRARGRSRIVETIFDDRFQVAGQFARLGAHLTVEGSRVVVDGVPVLRGAPMVAGADLRGAAALVLAGLGAQGESTVAWTEVLARGYDDLAGDLRSLGADVVVLDDAGGSEDRRMDAAPAPAERGSAG